MWLLLRWDDDLGGWVIVDQRETEGKAYLAMRDTHNENIVYCNEDDRQRWKIVDDQREK